MTTYTRTCTLVVVAACTPLACGDDGTGETGDTKVTTLSEVATPGDTSQTTADTEPPPPTTGDATSDSTTSPVTLTGTDPTDDPPTSETSVTTPPSTDTTDSNSSTGPATCAQGDVVCDGDTAKVCDGDGGFDSETPCADACAPGLGCVACVPDSAQCAGDLVQVCRPDGSGYDDGPTCDPLLGLTCDPNAGACAGACAELDSLSYIGCEYYPVVTAQLDNFIENNPFAVGVANTTASPATITVTQGPNTIETVEVAANSVELLILPWVDDLVIGFGPTTIAPMGAYRLRSTQPVTVYQYNPLNADITNDALAA